jgi:hypothetical protein
MNNLTHLSTNQLQKRAASRQESRSETGSLSCANLIAEWGEEFTAAMRLKTALWPKPLEALDVVDVFSAEGAFLFRGIVEERQEAHALIRVTVPHDSPESSTSHKVAVESCRYADAAPPPATLGEWEAARGASRSRPPL